MSENDSKMKPEVKEKWVAALRSGEHEQGTAGALNESGQLCCLGVLCEVAVKAGLEVNVWDDGRNKMYDGQVAFLPISVTNWAGVDQLGRLPKSVPLPLEGSRPTNSLPVLNDSGSFSFAQIADIIEEQL